MSDMSLEGNLGLDEVVEDFEDSIEEEIKAIAKLFYKYQSDNKVGQVPVVTGRYRFSWNAAVNERDESHPDISPAHGANHFPVPEFELEGEFELGDTINLTNALPYAAKLFEDSHVQQVPNEFFANNFQAALLTERQRELVF